MSLKTIKKNYTSLLKAFSEAGVKLNESQKSSLDNFIADLETTMNEQRDDTIRATKKLVEEKLEKEYKEVVESIIKHQKEHSELAGKVQDKVIRINESNKIADAVDSFLNEYVEEVLPKKTIVDYTRMQKLEKIQESLKEMLVVSDADIDSKFTEEKEKLVKESEELKEKLSMYEKKIDDSCKACENMSKQISELKAKEFVQEKIKDLPVVESKKVLKKTSGMDFEEVKKNYNTILESVKEEIRDEQSLKEDEKNLEEAITDILEGKKKENASTEEKSDKDVEGMETDTETPEETAETTDDDESVVVSESQMQSWIETLNRITPKK